MGHFHFTSFFSVSFHYVFGNSRNLSSSLSTFEIGISPSLHFLLILRGISWRLRLPSFFYFQIVKGGGPDSLFFSISILLLKRERKRREEEEKKLQ